MCGRPKAACSTENDCTTHGLQMHLKSCHLGQRTRHLLATSGSIPVKSNKSFMLSTKTANRSIVHRERSDIRKQLLSIITGRLSLKAAVIPGARDASMSLYLSPAVDVSVPVTSRGLCVKLQVSRALRAGERYNSGRGREDELLRRAASGALRPPGARTAAVQIPCGDGCRWKCTGKGERGENVGEKEAAAKPV